MVGAFPGMSDDFENERLLGSLLQQGITTFVCLQREYDPAVEEHKWRSGVAIRPYFRDAVALARAFYPERVLQFIHFGIEDCNVVEDDAVTEFAVALARRIATTREVVYLHCWGGHGRAGTVVCLLLHFLYDLDAAKAMLRCQYVHDLRRVRLDVGSPQTQTQRDQVSRVIARSIVGRKVAAAAAAERAAQDREIEERRVAATRRASSTSLKKAAANKTPVAARRATQQAPHTGPTPVAPSRQQAPQPQQLLGGQQSRGDAAAAAGGGTSLPALMTGVAVGAQPMAAAPTARPQQPSKSDEVQMPTRAAASIPSTAEIAGVAPAAPPQQQPPVKPPGKQQRSSRSTSAAARPAGGRKIVSQPLKQHQAMAAQAKAAGPPGATVVPVPPTRPPPQKPSS